MWVSAPHKMKCLSIYNTVIMVPKGVSETRKSLENVLAVCIKSSTIYYFGQTVSLLKTYTKDVIKDVC